MGQNHLVVAWFDTFQMGHLSECSGYVRLLNSISFSCLKKATQMAKLLYLLSQRQDFG